MITLVSSYAFVGLIVLISEGRMRKGKHAKDLKCGRFDRKSTTLIITIAVAILLGMPFLYFSGIGQITSNIQFLSSIGIALLVAGGVIRILAMRTLGKFYTRTLLVVEEQKIVRQGIYKFIRHPGYLGFLLIWIGLGVISTNWIAVSLISIVAIVTYLHRIRSEESMLLVTFGDEYREYMKKTWRLIPFLY